MTSNKLNRREMMRLALMGGVGATLFKYDPSIILNPRHYASMDGFQNLVNALKGGPESERLFAALAQQTVNDVVFVHVKFYMGMNGNYFMKIKNDQSIIPKTDADKSGTFLTQAGFDIATSREKHSAARLNQYVSNMIYHGTIDGQPRGANNIIPTTEGEIAASESEAAGILADYHVYGSTGLDAVGQHKQETFNINFTKNPNDMGQGCINYMLESLGVLRSPLGIVALGTRNNIIANAGGTALPGRTIKEFVDGASALAEDGYVKKSSPESLAVMFDSLAARAATAKSVRDNVRASVLDLKAKISTFSQAMPFESQNWTPKVTTPSGGTKTETIGYFVLAGRTAATGLYNNYAIGVNTIDLNGQKIDVTGNGMLNALDAIQQTSIGLHILIRKLKAEGKSYVIQLESELSRDLDMGDSGVLSAVTFVGGPKFRSQYRSSFLAPMALNDTNKEAAAFRGGSMVNPGGSAQDAGPVKKDNLRLGVAQIIAEATGQTSKIAGVGQPRVVFTKA